jgi:hypothetical protein
MSLLKLIHEALFRLLKVERRFDPFFRPAFDAIFQEPLARLIQVLINLRRQDEGFLFHQPLQLPSIGCPHAGVVGEDPKRVRWKPCTGAVCPIF